MATSLHSSRCDRVFLLLCVGWTSACATGDSGPAPTATVTMSESGYPIVENTEVGIWEQTGERWTVEEDLRIGALGGEGPEVFGELVALRVDDEGNLYVLDNQAAEVRVFDLNGDHLFSFGGMGDGPGDFPNPYGMVWGPGDTLLVYRSSTFDLFNRGGEFIARHRRFARGVAFPWPGQFGPDGRLLDMAVTRDELPENQGPEEVTTVHLTIFRTAPDFAAQDTLPPFVYRYPTVEGTRIPFTGNIRYYFAPDGTLWMGESDGNRLLNRTPEGDTLRVVTFSVQPPPVSTAEKDSVIALYADREFSPIRIDPDQIPDEKDAIGRMITMDDSGNLWVSPFLEEDRIYRVFDVFDPEGYYLGQVELPFRLNDNVRMTVRGDFIYGVTLDDFDVPYVVRARITRTVP